MFGYAWLLAGTGISLFAVHGRWDLPLAAWLFNLFLLRFTRTSGAFKGVLWVWVAYAIGVAFWLYESGLDLLSPILLLCLVLSTVLVLPFLIDRLVTPRLAVILGRAASPRRKAASSWQRLAVASGLLATLVFPLARVAAEYAVATLSPAGSIMGSLAATQHDNLPLLQIAAITGGYGISFLIAWFASAANHVCERGLAWPRIRLVVLTFGAVLAVAVVGGGIRLAFFPADSPTVRVAGVSPDRSVDRAVNTFLRGYPSLEAAALADPSPVRQALAAVNDNLLALSEREALAGAKIVVWPEVGGMVREADKDALIAQAGTITRRTGSYLSMGVGVLTTTKPYLRNQTILIDPQGQVVWTYDKAHPVPGMDTTVPGDGRVPTVDTPYGRLGAVICFDADFPALMRQAGRQGVDIILVPSNDWPEFGVVHSQKAAIRAVENGYALVRHDSNGLARAVDHQGHVLATADYFTTEQQTMVANVPVSGTRTIYAMVGDLFAWLCLGGLVLLAGAAFTVFAGKQHRALAT